MMVTGAPEADMELKKETITSNNAQAKKERKTVAKPQWLRTPILVSMRLSSCSGSSSNNKVVVSSSSSSRAQVVLAPCVFEKRFFFENTAALPRWA